MRLSVAAALTVLALAGCGSAETTALGPGRPWRLAYDGYGHVSASTHHGVIRVTLQPGHPTSPADTHAALVLSRDSWRDITAEIRVRTNHQLREPRPNAWEVGWILWHYVNDQHFYYIALKPNGWELGKADPDYPGHQRFLATGTHPAFPPGRWYAVRVQQRGNVIQVNVDGHHLVRFIDAQGPYLSGRVGLYVEDASATFQPAAFPQAHDHL
jgi:YD repeat-containing protein